MKVTLLRVLLCLVLMMVISIGTVASPVKFAYAVNNVNNSSNSSGSLTYGAVKNLAPGVTYRPFSYTNWASENVNGHMVEITPGKDLLELRPALGNDVLGGRETVSSLAQSHGAVAAINAGFFDGGTGYPIGGIVVDGTIQYNSDFLRTSLGWTGKGAFSFGYFAPIATVTANNINFYIDVYNRTPQAKQISLITSLGQPAHVQGIDGMVKLPLKKINADTYVVTSETAKVDHMLMFGAERIDLVRALEPGEKLRIDFDNGPGLAGVEHLVTGGPLLVQDGIPVFHAINEGFRGNVLAPNARTAIGIKKTGNVLLVVVEKQKAKPADAAQNTAETVDFGIESNHTIPDKEEKDTASPGLTLDELAWLMAKMGSVKAAALDGGGSSAMWAGGKLVSKPSDTSERKVANALLVLYQIPTYLDGKRVYFDVPSFIDRGRTLVPLRGIFELLNAEVDWNQETQTVLATIGSRSIKLTIGQNKAMVGDKPVVLDVAPRVVNNRTMVPLRFIGEALGAKVDWQNKPKAVYISSPGEVL